MTENVLEWLQDKNLYILKPEWISIKIYTIKSICKHISVNLKNTNDIEILKIAKRRKI